MATSFRIQVQMGTDTNGQPVYRKRSYSRVKPAAADLDIPGAHCRDAGMNFKSAGVAVIGNLMDRPPTPEQWKLLIGLVRELCRRYSVPPGRVLGHSEVPGAATDCPGRHMDMARLREEIASAGEDDSRKEAAAPGKSGGEGGGASETCLSEKAKPLKGRKAIMQINEGKCIAFHSKFAAISK
ncbi:N-acetylmuramoyl-L-alanine amidase [Moorella sp. E306M]|uniref:N-acetylmuramoyl-L-alanine amidase n=1 Tax=Moorella sp. E306M TaxID=2572683 RepID=UPI0021105AFE|nr:N-acetylmuramoyl-L-alanine amidase [Moorella sp. E306M]